MAKSLALVIGIVFLLVGAAGLFPNTIVGENAMFVTDFTHNLIHLVVGLIFVLVAEKATAKSSATLKTLGVIVIIVAALGFFYGTSIFGFISTNAASNWFHLVIGLISLIAGFSAKKA
jgi:uncharacterized membrane protein HdeD (DUF308 family)